MVDTVTSTLLENGPRNWGYRFTSFSDGTGESSVVKVDGTSSGPLGVNYLGNTIYPGVHIKISRIVYDVKGMGVRIQWDANTDADAVNLGADVSGELDFRQSGGIFIPTNLTGATGKILFTTTGQMLNSTYTIVLYGTKGCQF